MMLSAIDISIPPTYDKYKLQDVCLVGDKCVASFYKKAGSVFVQYLDSGKDYHLRLDDQLLCHCSWNNFLVTVLKGTSGLYVSFFDSSTQISKTVSLPEGHSSDDTPQHVVVNRKWVVISGQKFVYTGNNLYDKNGITTFGESPRSGKLSPNRSQKQLDDILLSQLSEHKEESQGSTKSEIVKSPSSSSNVVRSISAKKKSPDSYSFNVFKPKGLKQLKTVLLTGDENHVLLSSTHSFQLWDIVSGTLTNFGEINSSDFIVDAVSVGENVAAITEKRYLFVWKSKGEKRIARLSQQPLSIHSLFGKYYIVGDVEGGLCKYSNEDGRLVSCLSSPNSFASDALGSARVKTTRSQRKPKRTSIVEVSNMGNYAVCLSPGDISLWDVNVNNARNPCFERTTEGEFTKMVVRGTRAYTFEKVEDKVKLIALEGPEQASSTIETRNGEPGDEKNGIKKNHDPVESLSIANVTAVDITGDILLEQGEKISASEELTSSVNSTISENDTGNQLSDEEKQDVHSPLPWLLEEGQSSSVFKPPNSNSPSISSTSTTHSSIHHPSSITTIPPKSPTRIQSAPSSSTALLEMTSALLDELLKPDQQRLVNKNSTIKPISVLKPPNRVAPIVPMRWGSLKPKDMSKSPRNSTFSLSPRGLVQAPEEEERENTASPKSSYPRPRSVWYTSPRTKTSDFEERSLSREASGAIDAFHHHRAVSSSSILSSTVRSTDTATVYSSDTTSVPSASTSTSHRNSKKRHHSSRHQSQTTHHALKSHHPHHSSNSSSSTRHRGSRSSTSDRRRSAPPNESKKLIKTLAKEVSESVDIKENKHRRSKASSPEERKKPSEKPREKHSDNVDQKEINFYQEKNADSYSEASPPPSNKHVKKRKNKKITSNFMKSPSKRAVPASSLTTSPVANPIKPLNVHTESVYWDESKSVKILFQNHFIGKRKHSSSAEQWWCRELAHHKYIVVIIFSPVSSCSNYVSSWCRHVQKTMRSGGLVMGLMGANQKGATQTQRSWNINFPVVGDADDTLVDHINQVVGEDESEHFNGGGFSLPRLFVTNAPRTLNLFWPNGEWKEDELPQPSEVTAKILEQLESSKAKM